MTAMPLILTNVWQGHAHPSTPTTSSSRAPSACRSRMVLTKIYLPSILPAFFAGARLAFGFGARVSSSWRRSLGASSGIGYRLRQSADLVQTDQVFAWTLTLVDVDDLSSRRFLLKPLENVTSSPGGKRQGAALTLVPSPFSPL